METQSVTSNAVLTIAGQKVPMVESVVVRVKRDVRTVGGYGMVSPQAYLNGPASYEIELRRVRLPVSEGFDQLDFFTMDNFTFSMYRDGQEIGYTGCRWTQVEETLSGGEHLVQKAVLTATGRGVA